LRSYRALSYLLCSQGQNHFIGDIDASTILYCHLFDVDEVIDDKPPLRLYSVYCEDRDELRVYFTDDPTMKLQTINMEQDFFVQVNDSGKLVAVLFRNANDRITREFPKEDREKLLKELELIYAPQKSSGSSNGGSAKKNCNCCNNLSMFS